MCLGFNRDQGLAPGWSIHKLAPESLSPCLLQGLTPDTSTPPTATASCLCHGHCNWHAATHRQLVLDALSPMGTSATKPYHLCTWHIALAWLKQRTQPAKRTPPPVQLKTFLFLTHDQLICLGLNGPGVPGSLTPGNLPLDALSLTRPLA